MWITQEDNNGYLKYHSDSGPLLIAEAKQGFGKSGLGRELLLATIMTASNGEKDWGHAYHNNSTKNRFYCPHGLLL